MKPDRIVACLADSALEVIAAAGEQLNRSPDLDPDTIHEFRVATKKLRAYWLLMSPAVGKAVVKLNMKDLRDVARPLAARRDDFVRDGLLQELAQESGRKTAGAIRFIRDDLFGNGDVDVLGQASDFRPEHGSRVLLTDAERWRDTANGDESADVVRIVDGFEATSTRACRLGELALEIDTPQVYHAWRRWVKYAYYQYGWVRSLAPDAPERYEKRLKKLGSLLGRLHDLHHLLEELNERSLQTSSPKAFRRTRERVMFRESRVREKVRRSARKVLNREPARVAHEVLEALRRSAALSSTPDLEFVSLADYEGDGTAAAAHAARPH